MKLIFTLITTCFLVSSLVGQHSILHGKITDEETGEELIGANITLIQNENVIAKTSTDFEGNYELKTRPGVYDLEVAYIGYVTKKVEKFKIGNSLKLDVKFESGSIESLEELQVTNCWWVYPNSCGIAGINKVNKVGTVIEKPNIKNPSFTIDDQQLVGVVLDEETNNAIVGANVTVFQNDRFITGASTNLGGDFKVLLLPGDYQLVFSCVGYEDVILPDYSHNGITALKTIKMKKGITLDEVVIIAEKETVYACVLICHSNIEPEHCFHGDREEEGLVESRNEDSEITVDDAIELNCFPNPASSVLNITLHQSIDHLFVYNLIGKKLFQLNKVEAGITALDVSDYVAGNYLIKIVNGKKVLTKKFVVARE